MKHEPEALAGMSIHRVQGEAREVKAVIIFTCLNEKAALQIPRKICLLNSYLPALRSLSFGRSNVLSPSN